MTRTVLRRMLSAISVLALVSIVASGAVAGDTKDKMMRVQHMNDELVSGLKGHAVKGRRTREGLAGLKDKQSDDVNAIIRNVGK